MSVCRCVCVCVGVGVCECQQLQCLEVGNKETIISYHCYDRTESDANMLKRSAIRSWRCMPDGR